MIGLILFVCLCSNFVNVYSHDNDPVKIKFKGRNCSVQAEIGRDVGTNITFVMDTGQNKVDYGWLRHIGTNTVYEFSPEKPITMKAEKSVEGEWECEMLCCEGDRLKSAVMYNNRSYTQSLCRSKVIIVSPNGDGSQSGRALGVIDRSGTIFYSVIGVAVLALVIIVAQTACILDLKAKAKVLDRHKNLSKKAEPTVTDAVRYCSNPRPKGQKLAPIKDIERESVIYEAPNVGMFNDQSPILPPQPPEINTIPRKPRHDNGMAVGPAAAQQAILAAAMNSSTRHPNMLHPAFPRHNQADRDNVSNRPPLPLPSDDDPHEVYEEMEVPEENVYEPPPVINTVPPRSVVLQKKFPPPAATKAPIGQNPVSQSEPRMLRNPEKRLPLPIPKPQQPRPNMLKTNELEEALRRRNNGNDMSQANELEEAFKRRNNGNAMAVPIRTIPEPGHSSGTARKPTIQRPLLDVASFKLESFANNRQAWQTDGLAIALGPPVTTRPTGLPTPQPIHKGAYSDDRRSSSDDEWTYEPLKPMNSYDKNLYNV